MFNRSVACLLYRSSACSELHHARGPGASRLAGLLEDTGTGNIRDTGLIYFPSREGELRVWTRLEGLSRSLLPVPYKSWPFGHIAIGSK